MKIHNPANTGFSRLSVMVLIITLAAGIVSVSCSGSEEVKPAEVKKNLKSPEEIADSSMAFSGDIAQTTCLECHPAVRDGGFDIDFEKVKAAGMVRGKNMDVDKAKKSSEK